MKEYFKNRMDDLRAKQRATGQIEFIYRFRELQRAYEQWLIIEAAAEDKHGFEGRNGND